MRESVVKDSEHYKRMSQKLKKVNDYALQSDTDRQPDNIVIGDPHYLEVIISMPLSYSNANDDVSETYNTEKVKSDDGTVSMD